MFCKWCGNKIPNGTSICPTCGKEQGALTKGNGFWDLCDSKSEPESHNSHEQERENSDIGIAEKNKKQQSDIKVVLLLIFIILAGISVHYMHKQTKQLEEIKTIIEAEKKTVEEQPESVSQNKALLSEETISDDNL